MTDKLIEAIEHVEEIDDAIRNGNIKSVYRMQIPADKDNDSDFMVQMVVEAARSTLPPPDDLSQPDARPYVETRTAYSLPTPPDTQGALDALERLAHVRMELPFTEWSRISRTIQTALTRPSREDDAEELYHEKMAYKKTLDNLIPATEKTREINAKLLEALKFYAGHDIIVSLGETDSGLIETTRDEIGDGEPFGSRARQAIAEAEGE